MAAGQLDIAENSGRRWRGGINLVGEAGNHSPWMTWDDLASKDPDIIIASPCGFDLERTANEMYWLTGNPRWGADCGPCKPEESTSSTVTNTSIAPAHGSPNLWRSWPKSSAPADSHRPGKKRPGSISQQRYNDPMRP